MSKQIVLGSFRSNSSPLAVDYRPTYKISLIIYVLANACRGNKSSLNKLHFLIWSLKSKKNMEYILSMLEDDSLITLISWGVEPALNKALSYGVSEGVFTLKDDKYTLTPKGIDIEREISADDEIFIEEKKFIDAIGKNKVSESVINRLTTR